MISSTSSSEATRPFTWATVARQALVVLVVLVVTNAATWQLSPYFKRARSYHESVAKVIDRGSVHILFAGDSHVAVPLSDYLNNEPSGVAYSIAFGGDSYRECFAKFRYVIRRSPSVDTLVLTADPHMFAAGRIHSANRAFADQYFIADRDGSGLPQGWPSALLNEVPLFNDDFIQYLRQAVRKSGKGPDNSPSAGADGAGPSNRWIQLSEAERRAEAAETGLADHAGLGDTEEPFVWFERILQLAKAHHIRVIAVRYPVYPEYAAQASPEKVKVIDDILGRYEARVVDLRGAIDDPELFEDPDHVSSKGAGQLARLLEPAVGSLR